MRGSRLLGLTVVVPGPNVDAALAHVRDLLAKDAPESIILVGNERDAIALAGEINAKHVIIYSDSQRLMSADPAHVSAAMPVRYISHEELMELSDDDTVREASQYGISYEIRRAEDNTGTVIRANGYEDRSSPVTSITCASGYALVSMGIKPVNALPWKDVQMRLLERIATAGISLELLQSFAFGVRFLAPANRIAFMHDLAQEFSLAYQVVNGCTKVCIIGSGIRSTAGIFYHSLRALTERQIPVLHWADSNVTLSFVVNDAFAQRAENELHATLAPGTGVATGGTISFDADLGLLRVRGRETRLGKRQAQLLRYLLDNAGRIIEVEELAQHLFQAEGKDDLAAVRVHLHNLRKKIEDDPDTPRHIITVPEQGYVFVR